MLSKKILKTVNQNINNSRVYKEYFYKDEKNIEIFSKYVCDSLQINEEIKLETNKFFPIYYQLLNYIDAISFFKNRDINLNMIDILIKKIIMIDDKLCLFDNELKARIYIDFTTNLQMNIHSFFKYDNNFWNNKISDNPFLKILSKVNYDCSIKDLPIIKNFKKIDADKLELLNNLYKETEFHSTFKMIDPFTNFYLFQFIYEIILKNSFDELTNDVAILLISHSEAILYEDVYWSWPFTNTYLKNKDKIDAIFENVKSEKINWFQFMIQIIELKNESIAKCRKLFYHIKNSFNNIIWNKNLLISKKIYSSYGFSEIINNLSFSPSEVDIICQGELKAIEKMKDIFKDDYQELVTTSIEKHYVFNPIYNLLKANCNEKIFESEKLENNINRQLKN